MFQFFINSFSACELGVGCTRALQVITELGDPECEQVLSPEKQRSPNSECIAAIHGCNSWLHCMAGMHCCNARLQ